MQKFDINGRHMARFLGITNPMLTYLRKGTRSLDPYNDKLTAYYQSVKAGKVAELRAQIEYFEQEIN